MDTATTARVPGSGCIARGQGVGAKHRRERHGGPGVFPRAGTQCSPWPGAGRTSLPFRAAARKMTTRAFAAQNLGTGFSESSGPRPNAPSLPPPWLIRASGPLSRLPLCWCAFPKQGRPCRSPCASPPLPRGKGLCPGRGAPCRVPPRPAAPRPPNTWS